MKLIPLFLLAVLLTLGCEDGSRGSGDMTAGPETAPSPAMPPTADRAKESPNQAGDTAGGGAVAIDRQIIRSGSISLIVESLDSAERQLAALVRANGGYTANASRARIQGSTLTGQTEVRVPSPRFDALLGGVRRLGEVDAENISASDVTQEYIDLEARLKGQQQLEERLLKLLAERPGKLADIVEIEEKLAQVRGTIEGIQGQLRYYRNRIDFSTLTVNMTEPGAVGTSRTETFGGKIARAFDEGMEGIVGLIAGLITLLMVLLPLAVLVGLLWWAYRSWRRKHPVKKGTPPERPVREQEVEK